MYSWLLAPGSWLQAPGVKLLACGCMLFAVCWCCGLCVVGCLSILCVCGLCVVGCMSFAGCCGLCGLWAVYCLLCVRTQEDPPDSQSPGFKCWLWENLGPL